MTILLVFVGITVLLLILLNTKRWGRLARGAREARHDFEDELTEPEDER